MRVLKTITIIIVSFIFSHLLTNIAFSIFRFLASGCFLTWNEVIRNLGHPISIFMNIVLLIPSIIVSILIAGSNIKPKYILNILIFFILTYLIPTVWTIIGSNNEILDIETHQFLFSFLFVSPIIIILTKI